MLPTPDPDVIFEPVDGGGVLFSTREEVYFGLNEVAAHVWRELLAGVRDLDALVESVAARFPDAPERALIRVDVAELCQDLVASRLATAAATSPAARGNTEGATAPSAALRLSPSLG